MCATDKQQHTPRSQTDRPNCPPPPPPFSWGWEGVYVTTESRKPRDVRGHVLPLRFKVIDNRPPVAGAAAAQAAAEAAAGKKAGKVRLMSVKPDLAGGKFA